MTTAAAAPKIPLAIEITSDSCCPYCFLGHKKITKAIELAKQENLPLDFSVRFAPFQLDPTMLEWPNSVNKLERYESKFGKDRVADMIQAMKERGKEVGISFSYGGNLSQTVDSHRLIEKAYAVGGEEAQRKMVERSFKTYFEEEGDIGDHNLLARDAETAGIMSKDEALAFLQGDEMKKEVRRGIAKAQMRGISGVPFTILNNKLAISGAQETETFLDVFRKVASGEIQA